MPIPVENPDIFTVQIMDGDEMREFPLTRAEYDEIVAEAAARGMEVKAWIKEKLLAGAIKANARAPGTAVPADKRGLS